MPRTSLADATAEVVRRDSSFAAVAERAGPVRLRARRQPDAFGALARAIVYQQLAGAAATAIYGRFIALFDGSFTAEAVLLMPEERMRSAGLSGAKTASIRDLALHVADGRLPINRLSRLDDDEIVRQLSDVRGIGRWTAEMFLIFQLGRLDVWPVDDLGVRRGYQLIHELTAMPTPKALMAEGDRFRPYRTIAAWYCWQAVHLSRSQPVG
jgi:DNA-3-methyladenine glycosylase II